MVAKSAPDGYTLVAGTTAITIVSPLLMPNPPYQLQSFAPIGLMAVTPLVLEVPAASPHKDYAAYLAHVRANPGKVTIGHSGNGTTNHIAGTPREVVNILNAALNKALADPAIRKRLAELGSEVRPVSAAEFDRLLRDEETKLKALVKSGVLKGD